MGKGLKRIAACAVFASLLWASAAAAGNLPVLPQKDQLRQMLLQDLHGIHDRTSAADYLEEKLPAIRQLTQESCIALQNWAETEEGSKILQGTLALCREMASFSGFLLRNTAGAAWWCIQFPEFSVPGREPGFVDAVSMENNTAQMTQAGQVEIRFAVVDLFRNMKNKLRSR